jgi:hypothetical protein
LVRASTIARYTFKTESQGSEGLYFNPEPVSGSPQQASTPNSVISAAHQQQQQHSGLWRHSPAATTLNFTDLGSPYGAGGGGSSTPSAMTNTAGGEMEHHQGPPDGGTATPNSSASSNKSAFIELQQNAAANYPPTSLRYNHPHVQGQQHHHPAEHHHHAAVAAAGFAAAVQASAASQPRALGAYTFSPAMHHGGAHQPHHHPSYGGYHHLGAYPPQCASPPKDGMSKHILFATPIPSKKQQSFCF